MNFQIVQKGSSVQSLQHAAHGRHLGRMLRRAFFQVSLGCKIEIYFYNCDGFFGLETSILESIPMDTDEMCALNYVSSKLQNLYRNGKMFMHSVF